VRPRASAIKNHPAPLGGGWAGGERDRARAGAALRVGAGPLGVGERNPRAGSKPERGGALEIRPAARARRVGVVRLDAEEVGQGRARFRVGPITHAR